MGLQSHVCLCCFNSRHYKRGDWVKCTALWGCPCFNSRHYKRGDLNYAKFSHKPLIFQFLPLQEERRSPLIFSAFTAIFQFPLLLVGRHAACQMFPYQNYFNSLPYSWGDLSALSGAPSALISIPAPTRGATPTRRHLPPCQTYFNSRPYTRGDPHQCRQLKPTSPHYTNRK